MTKRYAVKEEPWWPTRTWREEDIGEITTTGYICLKLAPYGPHVGPRKTEVYGLFAARLRDVRVIDPITDAKLKLGHGLGLGHHSNEADLMGETVGYEGGGPSACDVDGFVTAHHWLTVDGGSSPHLPHVKSITCN